MYRLIIVDDDEIIRERLVNCVDWKSLEFEVVELKDNRYYGILSVTGQWWESRLF